MPPPSCSARTGTQYVYLDNKDFLLAKWVADPAPWGLGWGGVGGCAAGAAAGDGAATARAAGKAHCPPAGPKPAEPPPAAARRCGANPAVAQLLQCTGNMVVTLEQGDAGLCALTYAPVLATGTLRALPLFPCTAMGYVGIGADAVSAGEQGRGGGGGCRT